MRAAFATALFLSGATPDAPPASETAVSLGAAVEILFQADAGAPDKAAVDACVQPVTTDTIACLIGLRFASDPKAAAIAQQLYRDTGSVSGLLPRQSFDGEYRGKLSLVPHLPVKQSRVHLEWVARALTDIDAFFAVVRADGARVNYRWRDLDLRFFESVKRRTPSAFAHSWQVAYNVRGSLHTTPTRVKETLFHEVFHLNDFAHGVWSEKKLKPIYDRIVLKCGMKTACLTPYAPDSIQVRVKGGTYYAFMPDNGVMEYAADLAKRWFVEHDQLLRLKKLAAPPFKCGTPENAEAWQLMIDEFFGGIDKTPACAPP